MDSWADTLKDFPWRSQEEIGRVVSASERCGEGHGRRGGPRATAEY